MLKAIKKKMKDQRGFTLIELLAVIVILGIIAAIAIPSISNIIENSKRDAHVSTAQQMANAARIAVTNDDVTFNSSGVASLSISDLESKGYLDNVDNPSDKTNGYNKTTSLITVTKGTNGDLTYAVTLIQGGTSTTPKTYLSAANPKGLKRTAVTNP